MRHSSLSPRSRVLTLVAALLALAIVPAGANAAPKKVKLAFSASTYTAVEGNTFSVTVLRTGNTRVPASVDYTTQNGTAAAPGDFTASSGTLNFAVGETRKTISVATVDNQTAGAASTTFTLKLSNGQPDAVPPGKTTATLRILDNDGPGTIDFSSPTYSVVEGAGVATITVTRAAASNLVESVDYTTTELAAGAGHATADTDYTTTTGTLTFDTGELSKSFQVPVADDSDFEGDETLNVTLSNPQNVTNPLQPPVLGTNNPARLTIVDDDVPTFGFSHETYSANESDGTATITVTRSGATNVAADIGYSDDGSGTATGGGVDYTLTAGTLHFDAGQTTDSFDVAIVDDSVLDEANETVGLQLTEGATVVDSALLSIVDNDSSLPSVQFANTNFTVDEADSTATLTVTLSEPAAGGETVDYATADLANPTHATAGSDYTATNGTLTFTAGQTSRTIDVALLPDTDPEDDEDFKVTLSNASGLQIGDPNPAQVTILDDDGTGTLELSALRYDAAESSGHATITVRRVGGSGGTASVDYATSDGSAHAPADYTAVSGTLNFANGETQKTIEIPLAYDGLVEGDETVSIALTNFVSDDDPNDTKAAVLHIADDGQSGPVQFSAGSYDVSETAGSATITVTRIGGLGGPVTVDYAGSDGTHGKLTFAPGDASEAFQVPVTDDNVHTGTRTVDLSLSNPGGGTALGNPATATLSIADDEPASSASTDKTAPVLTITAKKVQKVRKTKRLVFKVRSNEPASLKITLKYRKGKGKKRKVVIVKRTSKKVAADKTVKVTVKLNKKQLRILGKGRVKGKVKLTLSVRGTDAAGNGRTVNKTVTAR